MDRRDFLKVGAGVAAHWATLPRGAYAAATDTPLRMALIGCGWYGKTDLFHLMQCAARRGGRSVRRGSPNAG